jgi:cellulose biosynthesis protein BcsQ
MLPSDIRLYTWVDIEDVLLRSQQDPGWPDWLVWGRAYWDNLTLGIRLHKQKEALDWIAQLMEPRFSPESATILLEGLSDQVRAFPVFLEETEDNPSPKQFIPTLARPSTLWLSTSNADPVALDSDLPPVVAFHSFKGGVGRTSCALALAQAMTANRKKRARVLVVDADLEAPGLTWLLRSRLPSSSVSLTDLLALIHGDTDPMATESIRLVADRAKDMQIEGIYVLPSFRTNDQFQSLEIRPEHLIHNAQDPFILTSALARLGKLLDVEAVIVDLRAGLSELSAGLLLDPRVYRVIVTTLSAQSMEGTRSLLALLGRLAPSRKADQPIPTLIATQIPEEYLQRQLDLFSYNQPDPITVFTETFLKSAAPFWDTVSLSSDDDENQGEPGPIIVTSHFDSRLIVMPGMWEEAMAHLRQSGLVKEMSTIIGWLPTVSHSKNGVASSVAEAVDTAQLRTERQNLDEFTSRLIYAETGDIEKFLTIASLRRLVSDNRAKVPVAVIVGAKGAGKTYTYLQMVRRGRWEEFVNNAGITDMSISAYLCPVLKSKNLQEATNSLVQDTSDRTAEYLGLATPQSYSEISDYLRSGLQENLHEGQWLWRWLNVIAWSAGFENGKDDAGHGQRFAEYLRQRKQYVVAIVDGLEDLFQTLSSQETEQVALRSLLQEVPDWLEQQPGRPIGLLTFVRRDMLVGAVRQNSAQLMARYEPYALKWSSEEALRLVAWTATQAKIPLPEIADLQDTQRPDLINALVPLWGRKLGNEKSNEARSAEWVIAALSDLKGQIQARDIIRLLNSASQSSISDTYWKDRVLAPTSIRSAVEKCSIEKVAEIRSENQDLNAIFQKLAQLPEESKRIPFTREKVGLLQIAELLTLEDNGVVLRDRDKEEYYMPEIFRTGLGFKLKTGARPRVLALSRRSQK